MLQTAVAPSCARSVCVSAAHTSMAATATATTLARRATAFRLGNIKSGRTTINTARPAVRCASTATASSVLRGSRTTSTASKSNNLQCGPHLQPSSATASCTSIRFLPDGRGAATAMKSNMVQMQRTDHQRRTFSSSSFMRRVLDQVQRDLEKSEDYQKAKKDFTDQGGQESAEKLRQRAMEQEEKLRKMKESVEQTADKTASYFRSMRASVADQQEKLKEKTADFSKQADENESLKNVKELASNLSAAVSPYAESAKSTLSSGIDSISAILAKMEDPKAASHKQWKQTREAQKAYNESLKAKKEAEATAVKAGESSSADQAEAPSQEAGAPRSGTAAAEEAAPAASRASASAADDPAAGALVVRKETAWDRFGANVRDMPLLNSFYDNPLFDRLFQETEIAQALREMKEAVPRFRLAEFTEEVEQVIAPAIVRAYLEADVEFLKQHCGEAAFMAVWSSIKERRKLKLVLDPDVRVGPEDVELKGARGVEGGNYSNPTFVFTFHTQQINCLRKEADNEVAEGAVDDIRQVSYAIAVTRHPYCDEDNEGDETTLEFPWLVSELAIVGNQPVW